jgi:quercetin dioxygenase-like cupin family protein
MLEKGVEGHAPGVPEAELKQTEAGLVPVSEGWFVLNARDASWIRSEERGQDTDFQGRQEWPQLGFRIQVLRRGQRGMYHGEQGQEDFLVVSGECVLVIEGEERRLKAWDFVHCPPWTRHVFVGAGDEPCGIVMVGNRVGGFEVRYAVDEVASRHDASVLEETSSPDEAYARWGPEERSPYVEGSLPTFAPERGRRVDEVADPRSGELGSR